MNSLAMFLHRQDILLAVKALKKSHERRSTYNAAMLMDNVQTRIISPRELNASQKACVVVGIIAEHSCFGLNWHSKENIRTFAAEEL